MHATIDVRFELSIDDDKTLPLATLAEAVTDQNLEAVLLESLVESLDAASVEALCGEKHAHGNGDQRFQRAGTDTRTAVTTAGEHEFSLHYVEDTAASPDESSCFRPVEDVLDFDGQNRYQQDIAAKSVDLATSLSYRDAANHGDSFVSMPSPTTINRRAKKYGHKLKQFLPDCVAGTDADAVIPDGTKCHSQDDDRSSHSVQATLGEDTAEESRSLLDLSVNADWDETAAELDDIGAVTDDATVVSDADSGIVTAFTDENRDHQLDLVHVGRTLGYTLWDDGVFSLDRRKGDFGGDRRGVPSEELCGEASSSGGVRGDPLADRAKSRAIREDSVATGAVRVSKGCRVSSAVAAVDCDVRRARCRGVRGSVDLEPRRTTDGRGQQAVQEPVDALDSRGIEAILQLRLVKYADPEYYQAFLDELLQRSTKTAINCDLSIESTSGKV